MRGVWLALGLLILVGCGGSAAPPSAPPADPGAAADTPGPAFDPTDFSLEREGAAIIAGTVTLNGTTVTDPSYLTAPFTAKDPSARQGYLTLVQVRARTTPEAPNAPRVRFNDAGRPTYGYTQVAADNSWQYMPILLTNNKHFHLVLYNSPTESDPLYDEAVTWDYRATSLPREDRPEPNDDDDLATVDDRTLAIPIAPGPAMRQSLHQAVDGSVADLEDWHTLTLEPNQGYYFDLGTSNGLWGGWSLDLELVDRAGATVATLESQEGAGGRLTYAVPAGAGGRYYLRVSGDPVWKRGNSVYYVQYSLQVTLADPIPDLRGVDPVAGITGTALTLAADNQGGPATAWTWEFGSGAEPASSTEAAPTVTLGAVGDHQARVTATNDSGSSTFDFTLTVHPTPPDLSEVIPTWGVVGDEATFAVTNSGGPVAEWGWTFLTGTDPRTSTDERPAVTFTAAGLHEGEVVARNSGGESRLPFVLQVWDPVPPEVTAVDPAPGFALRPTTFTASLAGIPADSYAWDFGGGATPNTSTDAAPAVTLGEAGTYNGRVTVTNRFGETTFPFTFDSQLRKLPLDLTVITSEGAYPTPFWSLTDWEVPTLKAWMDTHINSLLAPAGVVLDLDLMNITTLDRPDLYNIDSGAEQSDLLNFIYNDPDPNQVVLYIINRNNATGWAGVMDDRDCNRDNAGRGCVSVSYGTEFMRKIVGHELGHVFDLPHTRTNRNPLTELNYNLMGYGTNDVSLSHDITTEEPGYYCQIYPGQQMDQYRVMNDWIWTLSGLP
ncbi:MAG TPA: PKD domain-containing protein [bacterium]|nr:PKD domain-containing protein [bacterium]